MEDLDGIEGRRHSAWCALKSSAEDGTPAKTPRSSWKSADGVFALRATDGGEPVRTTGADGMLEFKKLGSGTYRFVETAAAPGYDKDSVTYSPETFTISTESAGRCGHRHQPALADKPPVEPVELTGGVSLKRSTRPSTAKPLKNAAFRLSAERQPVWGTVLL